MTEDNLELNVVAKMPVCDTCWASYHVRYPENYDGRPCQTSDCDGTIEMLELVPKSAILKQKAAEEG